MLFDIHGRMIKRDKRLRRKKNELSQAHIRTGMFMINDKGNFSMGFWRFEINRKNMFKKKEWDEQAEKIIF